MALSATSWLGGAASAPNPLALRRAHSAERRLAQKDAPIARDAILDIVVMLSVLMFVALATGLGLLALQAGGLWT